MSVVLKKWQIISRINCCVIYERFWRAFPLIQSHNVVETSMIQNQCERNWVSSRGNPKAIKKYPVTVHKKVSLEKFQRKVAEKIKLSLKAKIIYFPSLFPSGASLFPSSPSPHTPFCLAPSSARSMRQGHLLDAFLFLRARVREKQKPSNASHPPIRSFSPHVRLEVMESSFVRSYALCLFSPHKFLNTNFASIKRRREEHEE